MTTDGLGTMEGEGMSAEAPTLDGLLRELEQLLEHATPENLPEDLGVLERARGRALHRLTQAPAAGPAAEPLMDSKAAAEFLGVTPYYVETLARERRIPRVRLAGTSRAGRKREGRMVRFRVSDLLAWAEAQVDSGHGR